MIEYQDLAQRQAMYKEFRGGGVCVCVCTCTPTHMDRVSSPAVSEEVLVGLGGRAVLAVAAEMMIPEGTTSVVSVGHVQKNDTVMSYTTAKSHFQILPGYPCTVQVRDCLISNLPMPSVKSMT